MLVNTWRDLALDMAIDLRGRANVPSQFEMSFLESVFGLLLQEARPYFVYPPADALERVLLNSTGQSNTSSESKPKQNNKTPKQKQSVAKPKRQVTIQRDDPRIVSGELITLKQAGSILGKSSRHVLSLVEKGVICTEWGVNPASGILSHFVDREAMNRLIGLAGPVHTDTVPALTIVDNPGPLPSESGPVDRMEFDSERVRVPVTAIELIRNRLEKRLSNTLAFRQEVVKKTGLPMRTVIEMVREEMDAWSRKHPSLRLMPPDDELASFEEIVKEISQSKGDVRAIGAGPHSIAVG